MAENGTLSLTGKHWLLPRRVPTGGIATLLALRRGIDLRKTPSWESLENPLTLEGMEEAVRRIHSAVETGESVGIIGDYDADGVTGVAQLVRFFRRREIEPHVILPHRQKHGYGVKRAFIEDMHARGVTLLLTVDTGVTAAQEIARARSAGMDVIVLDHHVPGDESPDAILVHATNGLSGSGIAFTVIRALERKWEEQHIDIALASIGTVADVVPLLGDNRTIVQLGLASMNQGGDHPVFDLANAVRRDDEPLTSAHIGFRIAPRINAAGRVADPSVALRALLGGRSELEALHTFNEERQETTRRMMAEAVRLLDASAPVLTTRSPAFHPGIIGLVASRLTEAYGKPSVVGAESAGGTVTCSCRSIPPYHITNALKRVRAHLLSFGGHAQAAGCTIERGRWRAFAAALESDASGILDPEDLVPTIAVDALLDAGDVTVETARSLQDLAPFGAGNPEPRLLLGDQTISRIRTVGRDDQHLQCRIGPVKAVGFGLGSLSGDLPARADVVSRLGIDRWGGYEGVQLFIEDLRRSAGASVQCTASPSERRGTRAGASAAIPR